MLRFRELYVLLLLLLGQGLGKPTGELDEDCELNTVETMHDFCCDLHDESYQFNGCEMEWHEKIHYTTEQQEQDYMFCTAECTFNETNFLRSNRKSLNMRAVARHLETDLADEEDEKLLLEAYKKCDKHALSLLDHKGVKYLSKRLAKYGCHVYAGLVMECVSNTLILKCPAERFQDKPACVVARDYLKQCMEHIKYKP